LLEIGQKLDSLDQYDSYDIVISHMPCSLEVDDKMDEFAVNSRQNNRL